MLLWLLLWFLLLLLVNLMTILLSCFPYSVLTMQCSYMKQVQMSSVEQVKQFGRLFTAFRDGIASGFLVQILSPATSVCCSQEASVQHWKEQYLWEKTAWGKPMFGLFFNCELKLLALLKWKAASWQSSFWFAGVVDDGNKYGKRRALL